MGDGVVREREREGERERELKGLGLGGAASTRPPRGTWKISSLNEADWGQPALPKFGV